MRINQDRSNIKYFLYARKSQDAEDRQVQSIEGQKTKMGELAKDFNYNILETLSESMTAKRPGRPVFNEMLDRIENGEANGLLCWQVNRLSRNPIDSGRISWMLQNGIIKSIRTYFREYLPEDNVLLFSVEAAESNQFILDLSRNVKRGNEIKRRKGWLPNMAPQGYLNDKVTKTVIDDPERFNLVKKMFELMLTGCYTPPKILKIANEDWGYRTRKTKKTGGKPLSRSGIYRIFTNIFYAGIIEYEDKTYEGKHNPMITLEEFDRVQALLGRKSRPKPKTHEFALQALSAVVSVAAFILPKPRRSLLKALARSENIPTITALTGKPPLTAPRESALKKKI